jgi:nucleoside 2-deoxyribosyltransferase
LKVYVAGKWEEKDRIREVQQQLRDAGHTITYDWTSYEGGLTQEQAIFDTDGVYDADALVAVYEKDLKYSGAMVELGMALAVGVPVHVLGNACDNCIFLLMPGVTRGIDGLLTTENK